MCMWSRSRLRKIKSHFVWIFLVTVSLFHLFLHHCLVYWFLFWSASTKKKLPNGHFHFWLFSIHFFVHWVSARAKVGGHDRPLSAIHSYSNPKTGHFWLDLDFVFSFISNVHWRFEPCKCNIFVFCIFNCPNIFLYW